MFYKEIFLKGEYQLDHIRQMKSVSRGGKGEHRGMRIGLA